jgi:hypothetical protein
MTIENPTAFKFGTATGDEWRPVEHRYDDVWDIERTSGPERLIIGPSSDHIGVVCDLVRELPEPFGLLYVLLVSRTGLEPARYQNPYPTDRSETLGFLKTHRKYLEGDGRHHLWVMSLPASSTIVYDHHNVIYAYGPLDRFEHVLRVRGLKRGPVQFPVPHSHNYNPEFDQAEAAMMRYWSWEKCPLQDGDD